MAKSCLKCKKWVTCRDPRKDINYSCNLYDEHRRVNSLDEIFELDLVPQGMVNPDIKLMKKADEFGLGHINELLSENKKNLEHKPVIIQSQEQDLEKILEQKKKAPPPPEEVRLKMDKLGNDNELSNFIYQSMEDAYDPATNSIRDSRVDDRDLRLADNYYDYCTSLAGKTIKPPFSRQLWVANHLLGEFCPRCTDKKYNSIHEVPVDMDPRDLYKRMQPLRGGSCPKCGAAKSELIISGELKDYIDLILILGQRSSKCQGFKTAVQTNYQGLTTFGELFREYKHLFNLKTEKEQTVFSGFEGLKIRTRNGMKPVGALYTKVVTDGYVNVISYRAPKITGTKVHPMAVLDRDTGKVAWKQLKDIQIGDAIVGSTFGPWKEITDELPEMDYSELDSALLLRKLPERMSIDLARFLGYLIADGNLSDKRIRISKSNKNKQQMKDIEYLLTKLFGLTNKFVVRKAQPGASSIEFGGKHLTSWLKQSCGLKFALSNAKEVPTCILKASEPMVKAFLKGYLICDSAFDSKEIHLCSASEKLMDQMQSIFGCLVGTLKSSRRTRITGAATNGSGIERPYYTFYMSRKYIEPLIDELGIKQAKKVPNMNAKDSQERIPIVIAKMMLEFLNNFTRIGSVDKDDTVFYEKDGKRHYISVSDIRAGWTKNRNFERERRKYTEAERNSCQLKSFEDVNLNLVKELHPKLYTALKIARNKNYFFSEVTEVNYREEKIRVYDVEVPDGHEYIANNLVSHNTSFSSTIATYVFHRFLKAPRMSDVCRGIQEFSPLTATFVGLTASRAIKLSWNPFSVIVENSDWFNSYFELLRFQGRKYDREFYKRAGLFIRVFHKNLDLYPSAPMKRSLRGDCLAGYVVINTSEGFLHFDEMNIRPGFTESNLLVDSPAGTKKVSHVYSKKSREVIEVITKNGIKIGSTPEHPMLVMRKNLKLEWVRTDELQVGDYIVSKTKRSKPLFGNNDIDIDQATIMGTFTANGYKNGITSGDPKVADKFCTAVKRLGFGVRHTPPRDTKRADQYDVVTNTDGSKYYAAFKSTLESWGYSASSLSAEKEIPLSIRTAPREIIHEFLEAYFACDSHINGGSTKAARAKGTNTGVEVELGSASEKLTRQLQTLLLQIYGIVGRIEKSVEFKSMGKDKQNAPKHYTQWLLTLTGYDAYRFIQIFKRAKVQKYKHRINDVPAGYGSDRRSVPYLKDIMIAMWRKTGTRMKYCKTPEGEIIIRPKPPRFIKNTRPDRFGANIDGRMPEFLAYECPEVYEFLAKMYPAWSKRLMTLIKLQPHFEQVASIEKKKELVPVYDVTVPDGHMFYANGLASHNTRFYASCDEISWWPFKTIQSDDEDEDDERERANADEVYSALNNSLSTVRAEVLTLYKRGINTVPQALGMYLSSPVSEKDMGCRLQRAAMEEGSKSLGLRLPTWEMNPLYSRQHPIIVDAYRKNPNKAERDFGANPPALTNTVFDKTAIQGCFKRYSNNWRVAYLEHDTYTVAKIIEIVKAETLQPSVLAFDAGLTNNAFSLCVAHKEGSRMVCTLVIEVVPKAGKQISYPAIYENVVKPLGQALNILSVGADRWNSINLLQQAEIDIPGCKSMQKSLQYKDLTACVTSISSGDVDFPHLELDLERVSLVVDYKRELLNMPVSHLALQLLTIKDSGVAYMKGDNYTDDIFRAVAMAHWMLFGGRLKERLRKAKVKRGDGKGDVGTGTSIVVAGRSGLITRSISNNVKGGKKGKYDI